MIICCGEALIDMLPRELPSGEKVLLPVSGGAIFNTAISLGRLGCRSGFFSGISTDLFGRQLEATLAESKVDFSSVVHTGQPTTLAFVELNSGNAKYVFYDENSAGRSLSVDDLPKFYDEVTALHFGAISLIPEPCGSAYEALLLREAPNRVISLDPNIRPNFIADAAGHRARILRMIGASDIVKVSDEDLEWLEPSKGADAAIAHWLQHGVRVVVMTRGAEGASGYTKNHTVKVDAQPAIVIDTVGAGDSFDAGFLAGLEERGALDKSSLAELSVSDLTFALELAAKVAAITVSRAGANPPWRRELAG
jgi:fructokinase